MYYNAFRNKNVLHYSIVLLNKYDAVLLMSTKHNISNAMSKAHLTITTCWW